MDRVQQPMGGPGRSLGGGPMKTIERARDGGDRRILTRAWRQMPHFSRFTAVGAAGLVVNQGLLWLLVSDAHVQYLVGAALATVGSTTFNFAGIESWVFRGRSRPGVRGLAGRFVAYGAVNGGALLFRLPLLYVLTSGLHIHYLLGNLITLVALALARFALSDRLIWPRRQTIPGEAQ
jgi:putative flippase GtrA